MIRRPPRSTLDRTSAASDVYKRQLGGRLEAGGIGVDRVPVLGRRGEAPAGDDLREAPVSYTHLRAPETVLDIVCPLLLETKKTQTEKKYEETQHTNSQHR